jgi:lipid A 3-O-deacylase
MLPIALRFGVDVMGALRNLLAAGLVGLGALSVQASNPAAQELPFAGVIDEVRVGIHAHEVHWSLWPVHVRDWDLSQISDVSFDVLFTSPDHDIFRWIGSPRPEIGTTLTFTGEESLLHAGLTWQLPVFDTPIFLEGTFGAALHNGYLTNAPAGRRNMGCRINFYERFGIGVNISENATALLTYEHTSNAELCDANDGLSNFGVRVGFKF